jgi:tRNA threonylcarbamoyladenosine biosynthesis protein TsaE
MRRWQTRSEDETRALGAQLAAELAPDGILLLEGDLGTGKTVLVRGLGQFLGIPAREIQSPTYTLIQEHRGPGGRLVHMDLYRLEPAETLTLGLEELFADDGIKAVEWAGRLAQVPAGALHLRLERRGTTGREIIEQPLVRQAAGPGAEERH